MERHNALRRIPLMMLGLLLTQPVLALDIELSFPDDFASRPAARSSMERAAAVWERTLRDPVTVRIDVFEPSPGELNGAQSATAVTYDFIDYSYTDFRAALVSDATSEDDALAISHLQVGPRMTFRMWDVGMNPTLFDGDEWINNYVSIPRTTAKALGLPHDDDGPDAEIYWNANYLDDGFDFDRTDGIDGTDFLAVAMHEIGHALGFTSGTSLVELVFAGELPIPPEWLPLVPVAEPLDLFRFSAESGPYFDVSPGGSPYFSIDGGLTNLAAFASGVYFGNGAQPDHWLDGSGIMDSYLDDDMIHYLSPLDRLAMDVIGWDLAADGDLNHDGTVDAADYVVWRNGLGTTYTQADYDVWRANFGQTFGGASLDTIVPESTTAALGLLALACLNCLVQVSHFFRS